VAHRERLIKLTFSKEIEPLSVKIGGAEASLITQAAASKTIEVLGDGVVVSGVAEGLRPK
jgi:hypothetical protein